MMSEYPKYMHRAPDERVIADDHFQERNYIAAGFAPGCPVPPHPLDHDGDGKKGGSEPGPRATARKRARRRR